MSMRELKEKEKEELELKRGVKLNTNTTQLGILITMLLEKYEERQEIENANWF